MNGMMGTVKTGWFADNLFCILYNEMYVICWCSYGNISQTRKFADFLKILSGMSTYMSAPSFVLRTVCLSPLPPETLKEWNNSWKWLKNTKTFVAETDLLLSFSQKHGGGFEGTIYPGRLSNYSRIPDQIVGDWKLSDE